jgi:hypothetical protein
VDGAGELSFEATECFAACLAFGLFAFEVGAGGRVDAIETVEGCRERHGGWMLAPWAIRCETAKWRRSWNLNDTPAVFSAG